VFVAISELWEVVARFKEGDSIVSSTTVKKLDSKPLNNYWVGRSDKEMTCGGYWEEGVIFLHYFGDWGFVKFSLCSI